MILALLLYRLFDLTFNQGQKLLTMAQDFSRKELRLTGARGKILDRNGLPLAYNETSYDVQFIKDPKLTKAKDRQNYTQSIIRTIQTIEENGGTLSTSFSISRGSDGQLMLSWPGLDPKADQESYNKQVARFRSNLPIGLSGLPGVKSNVRTKGSLDEVVAALRTYYFIPGDMPEQKAFEVLGVWQQVQYSAFKISYIPVVLANDVDMNTVAQVEVRANELIGMQIGQDRTRVYPNRSMAAHIIGYTGRMLDEKTIVQNEQAGYSRDDLVGISGIEKSEELELTGNITERTGTRVIEVDSTGKVVRELQSDNKQPTAGNNVMLTIDSGLQKIAEDALAKNVQMVHDEQVQKFNDPTISVKQDYQGKIAARSAAIGKPWPVSFCNSGAVVVMDVHTGEILAMASYPTYDLNLFSGGISQDELDKLQTDSANPLFNRAIASRGTPGSIFKMVTGLAGLMEGAITPNTLISDTGPYMAYANNDPAHAPKCYAPNAPSHQNLDIVHALEVSCNYFFYTVADKLQIDKLNNWADLLGLSSLTGVELPGEVKGQIGNQKTLYDPDSSPGGVASLVYSNIKTIIQKVCDDQHITVTAEKMDAVAREMMKLAEMTSDMGPDIRAILKNEIPLDPQVIAAKNMTNDISQQLVQIKWNGNDTITTGIGQSVTMITPIAAARYLSAIVNGGEVYDAKLIKSIISPEGNVREKAPVLVRDLNIPASSSYLDLIKQGMAKVVSDEDGGTAANEFKGFDYITEIGGKTGTAQVSKIDLENNAWFVCFAPFDKPEIAVVVYLPNGDVGHLACYTARQILQYYLDKKKQASVPEKLPTVDTQTH